MLDLGQSTLKGSHLGILIIETDNLCSLLSDNHILPLAVKSPPRSCGVYMVKGHPRINFWASGIKRQVAAKALRHPGHPLATLSISLLRYTTGWGVDPQSWVSTPRSAPLFS
jgi:hypothetical protein